MNNHNLKPVMIPRSIPEDLASAAKLYRDRIGWAVHPLESPHDPEVASDARGKKPLLKNWPTWTVSNATDDVVRTYWVEGNANLGMVLRPQQIVVDLDSKADNGTSVREWLLTQPELAAVPTEETAGGCHLHFICPDLPILGTEAKPYRKALTSTLTNQVNAELYHPGLNVVLSPSTHPSGARYRWIVTGEIPVVSWAQLQHWFGFKLPSATVSTASAKLRNAAALHRRAKIRFRGDLTTLDFSKVLRLGNLLDASERKLAVECPWRSEHSDAARPWTPDQSSTVVYLPVPGKSPGGFCCLHAHCSKRGLRDVLEKIEHERPGLVDQCCAELSPATHNTPEASNGRPRLELPGLNRPHGQFAADLGKLIAARLVWFVRGDRVVAVGEQMFGENVRTLAFHEITPAEFCTGIEQFVETGKFREDSDGNRIFEPCTISKEGATLILASPLFREKLPRIDRIVNAGIPYLGDQGLTIPGPGYNEKYKLYRDPRGPTPQPMDLETAKGWIHELLQDFPFDGEQSHTHAIARILTSVARAVIGWDARVPFFLYKANRERIGKDCLAAIAGLVLDGYPTEDAPLDPKDGGETRKRITTAVRSGRARMHFANTAGHIRDSALEQAITGKIWIDRVLGTNTELQLPNEIEFSMSANSGITYSGDLANRARRIGLFYGGENPNARTFARTDLHGWVLENRPQILSAFVAHIEHWVQCGRPPGKTPFTSFPEWARVIGGIMKSVGYGDPCAPDLDTASGNEEEMHMRTLFDVCHEKWPSRRVELKDIMNLIDSDDCSQLFGWIKFNERAGQTIFGKMLRRYDRRVLGGIKLTVHDGMKRRPKFEFSKAADGPGGEPTTGSYLPEDPASLNKPQTPPASAGLAQGPPTGVSRAEEPCAKLGQGSVNPVIVVRDAGQLPFIAAEIQRAGQPVALDIETYGKLRREDALSPFRGEIRLLTVGLPGKGPWIVDLMSVGYDLGPLGSVLQHAEVVGHNLKFDGLWLLTKCGVKLTRMRCTLTATRVLCADRTVPCDLGACIERELGIQIAKDQATSDWHSTTLTPDQIRYAAEDVLYLHRLWDALQERIKTEDLSAALDLELELLPVVVALERNGIAIDSVRLASLRAEARTKAEAMLASMQGQVGPTFNPNSVPQVRKALADRGLDVSSTSEEMLSRMTDPLAKEIVAYRKVCKQVEQAEALLDRIDLDARIHGTFNPLGTDTGRFTSSKPNLQNVGRGEMRACFVAAPGSWLIVADYSQIELRAAAAIAGEESMLEAFRANVDLHEWTASLILGKAPANVTKVDRQLAKAVNFGLLYGQSAEGLVRYAQTAYGVEISLPEAQKIRSEFFKAYQGLSRWHEDARRYAHGGRSEVRTRLGRRRPLPKSGAWWQRFTTIVNTPVQGSCADALKQAMVKLGQQLPIDVKIVSTVHDELILEAPEASAEQAKRLVETIMAGTMQAMFPEVPILVEAKICGSWAEK